MKRMTNIRKGLVPEGTRTLGGAKGCTPAVLRRSTDYKDLEPGQPDFVPGDLVSLAALWARAHHPMHDEPRGFYRDAYQAVCKGLGIPPVNELTRALGIDPEVEREHRIDDDFFRRAGIGRFLWARANMIGLQDPWGNVMEGDIWGQRAFESGTFGHITVGRGIDAYTDAANRLPSVIEHLDNALCALMGWDLSKSVSYDDLRTLHGMPEAEFDF